jgi:hypothetical protein
MKILSWNCRGLGNHPHAVRDLCQVVKEKRLEMVFLMETILSTPRVELLKCRLGFGSVFVVDRVGRSGGLALFWNDVLKVEIQNYSRFHINAVVSCGDSFPSWKFTGFYGQPAVEKRRDSWRLLRHLGLFSPMPWLCCGDFNEILDDLENFEGCLRARSQMEDFQSSLADCRLMDLGFKGSKFTWCNKRDGVHFVKRTIISSYG